MSATDDDLQAANADEQPHATEDQRRALAELVALSEEMGLYEDFDDDGDDDGASDRPLRRGDEHRAQE